ncbi:glutathione S-transferase N-terminal domain-containing protein [Dyella sp.]|uniref:glutathione S-transferase N-terminal domain-containing protein n=1 Tax=Dyella sp. TaxID=1869338 RepID=UPI003F7FE388
MTATPCLIGRSSSHFTRVPRMLALELGVDCAFQPVYDLGSRDVGDYGGNPAMKLPVLRLGNGQVAFGAENVARTLAELAPARIDMVWTEQLPGLEARNAQELVWHAMAAQVQLVFGMQAAKLPADNLYFAKAADGLANVLAWLEARIEAVLATLPPSRHVSLLELTLLCLIEHLRFRPTVALDAYPTLARFADTFGQRASAVQTAYRFDTPPAA